MCAHFCKQVLCWDASVAPPVGHFWIWIPTKYYEQCDKHQTCLISYNSHKNPLYGANIYHYLTHEEIEAQKD